MLEQWNNGSLKSSMAENQFSILNDHCELTTESPGIPLFQYSMWAKPRSFAQL